MQQLAPLSADVTTVYTSPETLKELQFYNRLHQEKYRDKNQSFMAHSEVLSSRLASDSSHQQKLFDAIHNNRFLAAGRVQAALGATEREVSPFNCSVSQSINDNMDSIMSALHIASKILRLGTGVGYNFSRLRPRGAPIKKLGTESSGPLSFMKIFDVMASTIASSGHRRGAQMGIMNVDHPDIEAFVDAKLEKNAYRQFNLSVGIKDDFMEAVKSDTDYPLIFNGVVFKTVRARALWEKITLNAYNSAEPGIIFIDRLNDKNNLYYCETIEATNPCSEQPLPPYGLCTLGSFNLMAYIYDNEGYYNFNEPLFIKDIQAVVEGYDNIFDEAIYAIPEHEQDALNKRRMGLGLTGIANALEIMCGGPSYGSELFCEYFDRIAHTLAVTAYNTSIELSKKRGPFPLFDPLQYPNAKFIKTLPEETQRGIELHGIRNSHLISYAPCGTISQCAWNVSSGVEPVFYHEMSRDVHMAGGKETVVFKDFAYREHNFKGRTLEECSVDDHMNVVEIAQRWCDSAVSKTVNVPETCSFEDYSQIYERAYGLGLKGITVFRPTELRGAVITKAVEKPVSDDIQEAQTNVAQAYTNTCASGVCER